VACFCETLRIASPEKCVKARRQAKLARPCGADDFPLGSAACVLDRDPALSEFRTDPVGFNEVAALSRGLPRR